MKHAKIGTYGPKGRRVLAKKELKLLGSSARYVKVMINGKEQISLATFNNYDELRALFETMDEFIDQRMIVLVMDEENNKCYKLFDNKEKFKKQAVGFIGLSEYPSDPDDGSWVGR